MGRYGGVDGPTARTGAGRACSRKLAPDSSKRLLSKISGARRLRRREGGGCAQAREVARRQDRPKQRFANNGGVAGLFPSEHSSRSARVTRGAHLSLGAPPRTIVLPRQTSSLRLIATTGDARAVYRPEKDGVALTLARASSKPPGGCVKHPESRRSVYRGRRLQDERSAAASRAPGFRPVERWIAKIIPTRCRSSLPFRRPASASVHEMAQHRGRPASSLRGHGVLLLAWRARR